jgi:hypothetical protein
MSMYITLFSKTHHTYAMPFLVQLQCILHTMKPGRHFTLFDPNQWYEKNASNATKNFRVKLLRHARYVIVSIFFRYWYSNLLYKKTVMACLIVPDAGKQNSFWCVYDLKSSSLPSGFLSCILLSCTLLSCTLLSCTLLSYILLSLSSFFCFFLKKNSLFSYSYSLVSLLCLIFTPYYSLYPHPVFGKQSELFEHVST